MFTNEIFMYETQLILCDSYVSVKQIERLEEFS